MAKTPITPEKLARVHGQRTRPAPSQALHGQKARPTTPSLEQIKQATSGPRKGAGK